MTKKPSIAPKPAGSSIPSLDDFIDRAAASVESRAEVPGGAPRAAPKNKKQIPLMILPPLLAELDAMLERDGVGESRSAWICKAIRERLDRQDRTGAVDGGA